MDSFIDSMKQLILERCNVLLTTDITHLELHVPNLINVEFLLFIRLKLTKNS